MPTVTCLSQAGPILKKKYVFCFHIKARPTWDGSASFLVLDNNDHFVSQPIFVKVFVGFSGHK